MLTLFAVWLIIKITGPLLNWFFIDATFNGNAQNCRDAGGACWSFIKSQFQLFLYGPYPREILWRPSVAGLMLALTVATTVFRLVSVGKIITLWIILVIVCYWLIGGGIGLDVVSSTKWGGLMLSLMLSVVGILCSIPIGIVLALGRRSQIKVVSFLSTLLIEGVRGIPLVTILFMATILLPLFLADGIELGTVFRVQIGIIIFSSAYIAEVVRGGLQGVDKGQQEAANALGLSTAKTIGLVILPQALTNVLSPIVGRCIALLKDTTLVIVIGLLDFLGIAKAASQNPEWLGFEAEAFVFCGMIYWILCFGLSRYGRSLEKTDSAKSH